MLLFQMFLTILCICSINTSILRTLTFETITFAKLKKSTALNLNVQNNIGKMVTVIPYVTTLIVAMTGVIVSKHVIQMNVQLIYY